MTAWTLFITNHCGRWRPCNARLDWYT